MSGRILVGIDGSPGSRAAAAWATHEARIRDAEIEAVHAWVIPSLAFSAPGFIPPGAAQIEAEGHRILETAFRGATEAGVKVHMHVLDGRPIDTLRSAATDPAISFAVVGRQGHGGLAGVLLGSVTHALTHHFPKPLVVVPKEWDRTSAASKSRVVIGLDGSVAALEALRWAAEAARVRGAVLELVVALERGERVAAREILASAVCHLDAQDLRVVETVAEGPAGRVLIERAGSAQLLVVGTRGLGRAREALVGSVGHSCTQHAGVPVVVVPHEL